MNSNKEYFSNIQQFPIWMQIFDISIFIIDISIWIFSPFINLFLKEMNKIVNLKNVKYCQYKKTQLKYKK